MIYALLLWMMANFHGHDHASRYAECEKPSEAALCLDTHGTLWINPTIKVSRHRIELPKGAVGASVRGCSVSTDEQGQTSIGNGASDKCVINGVFLDSLLVQNKKHGAKKAGVE